MLEIWGLISKLTVERSCTNVLSATNHFVKLEIWEIICSLTVERSLTSATSAAMQPPQLKILHFTLWHTLVKRCSSAHNATMQLHQLETSETASNRVNWFIVAVSSAPTSYSLGTLYEGPRYEYKICKCKWVMDAQTYMGRCYHLVQFNLADHLKKHKDSS